MVCCGLLPLLICALPFRRSAVADQGQSLLCQSPRGSSLHQSLSSQCPCALIQFTAMPRPFIANPYSTLPSPVCTLPRLRSAVHCHPMLSLLCTAHCLFSANLSYAFAYQHTSGLSLRSPVHCPSIAMPSRIVAPHCYRMSGLCHSCAHQCLRLAAPRHASAIRLEAFTLPFPCYVMLCYAEALPLFACASPCFCRRISLPGFTMPVQLCALLCPCVAVHGLA